MDANNPDTIVPNFKKLYMFLFIIIVFELFLRCTTGERRVLSI